MKKFYKVFEKVSTSLRAEQSPKDSVLDDVQIGDKYFWLVKSGNTYKVEQRQAPSANDPKFEKSKKELYSGDEKTAKEKFSEFSYKAIQDL